MNNPQIRFTKDDGTPYPDWGAMRLSNVLTEHKLTSTGKEEVYSVSVHKGVINQIEHLGRNFAAADTSKYKLVKPFDIIYTKSPTGDFPLGIIKQSLLNIDAIVSPLYGVFSPKNRHIGYMLHIYFESSMRVYNYLYSLVQKGAKNTLNITNEIFLSGKLTLPTDPEEQQKIAAYFTNLDAQITAEDSALASIEAHKRGMLQGLFPRGGAQPQTRFTKDDGTPYPDWAEVKLGEVAEVIGGFAFDSKEMSSIKRDFQIIKMSNIYQGILDLSRSPSYTAHCTQKEMAYLLMHNDILISLTGTTGKRDYGYIVLVQNPTNLLLNQRLACIRSKKHPPYFLFSILNTNIFLDQFFISSYGGTGNQSNVGIGSLSKIQIPLPCLEEQQKIAEFFTALDAQIEAQRQKCTQIKNYKKAMLQRMFV